MAIAPGTVHGSPAPAGEFGVSAISLFEQDKLPRRVLRRAMRPQIVLRQASAPGDNIHPRGHSC